MKPITPTQVTEVKQAAMPEEVIEAFNEMIAERWNGAAATVIQEEVINLIVAKTEQKGKFLSRKDISDKHYLDVEPIFRKAGWKVVYDKPGYNESYRAFFVFSKKDKS